MRRPTAAALALVALVGVGARGHAQDADGAAVVGAESAWTEPDGRVRALYRPAFVPARDLLESAARLGGVPASLALDALRSRVLLGGGRDAIEDAIRSLQFLDVPSPEALVDVAVVETSCRTRRARGGAASFDRTEEGPDTFFRVFRADFEPTAWLRSELVGVRPFEGTSVVGRETKGSGDLGGTLAAVLRGLMSDGTADLVTRPTLVCTEGVPAKVESTLALPVSVFSRQGERTTLRSENERAGVTLEVTADVVGADAVRLTLRPWVRRIEASDAAEGPVGNPVLRVVQATTTVSVPDGEMVVIGAIAGRRRLTQRAGWPALDRLPALDGALSAVDSNGEETDLHVLVRARILTRGRATPRFVPPGEAARLERLRGRS